MAEQVLNQFRSDKELREECVAIYESLGMDLNTAFRMFMERTRMVRGLPFPAVLPETRMTRIEAQKAIDDPGQKRQAFRRCHLMRSMPKSAHRGQKGKQGNEVLRSF